MRLMVIAARDDHRLLVRKHVEIQWPDAAIVEHLLGVEPKLDENFAAAGFDAVIIVAAPPTAATADFARAQALKPEFAPILLLLLEDAPQPVPPAVAGLQRLYGRKIDRERLVDMIVTASNEHRKSLALLRGN